MYVEAVIDLNELLMTHPFQPADKKEQHFATIVEKATNRYFPVYEKVRGKDVVAWLVLFSWNSILDLHKQFLLRKTEKKNYHLNINAMVLVGLGWGGRQNTTEGTECTTNLGEMQSCKNPGHTEVPKCPCFSLYVVSDKRHYSISFYIKFPPEVQNPLYHTRYVKALQLLL